MVDSYLYKADTQEEDVFKRRRNQHRINWAKFLTIYIRYIYNNAVLCHAPDYFACFISFSYIFGDFYVDQ